MVLSHRGRVGPLVYCLYLSIYCGAAYAWWSAPHVLLRALPRRARALLLRRRRLALGAGVAALAWVVHLVRRWRRAARLPSVVPRADRASDAHARCRYFTTRRDCLRVCYRELVTGRRGPADGGRLMVVANGIGCGPWFWQPLCARMRRHHPDWTVLTWDYRGLFGSRWRAGLPLRRMAIKEQTEDLGELLDDFGAARVDALVGWSTGVQVSLEFAVLYPDRVGRLCLLNGTHGNMFGTALQPVFRIPPFNDALHWALQVVVEHRGLLVWLAEHAWKAEWWVRRGLRVAYFGWCANGRVIEDCTMRYLFDIFGHGPEHMRRYIRFLQELDAHSCYHFLQDVAQPTLIVSGFLDVLTPAFQSFEMAFRMPNARHHCWLLGTHFVNIEYPEAVARELAEFATVEVAGGAEAGAERTAPARRLVDGDAERVGT